MRKVSEEVLRVWIKQAQQNRIEATEKIIEQFTPLLKSYAKKYSRHMHAYFEDLYQVGVVGLLHAIKKFDLTAKNPFYSYAVLCIVGMIKNHFRNWTWGIKVPAAIKQNYARFRDVSEALEIQSTYYRWNCERNGHYRTACATIIREFYSLSILVLWWQL